MYYLMGSHKQRTPKTWSFPPGISYWEKERVPAQSGDLSPGNRCHTALTTFQTISQEETEAQTMSPRLAGPHLNQDCLDVRIHGPC